MRYDPNRIHHNNSGISPRTSHNRRIGCVNRLSNHNSNSNSISSDNCFDNNINTRSNKMILASNANVRSSSRRRKFNVMMEATNNNNEEEMNFRVTTAASAAAVERMDWLLTTPSVSSYSSSPATPNNNNNNIATYHQQQCDYLMQHHHQQQPQPSQQLQQRKYPKHVSFHEPVVISTVSLDELTDEEHNQVWYSREEYSALQSALRTAVKLFRSSNWTIQPKGQCRRGLEKYQLHYERKRMERQHYHAVLSEQQRQRSETEIMLATSAIATMGMDKEELLRQASLLHSSWALQNALQTANHDAIACRQYRDIFFVDHQSQQPHQQHQHYQSQQQQQQGQHLLYSQEQAQLLHQPAVAVATADTTAMDDVNNNSYVDFANINLFPNYAPALYGASRRPTPPPPPPKQPFLHHHYQQEQTQQQQLQPR